MNHIFCTFSDFESIKEFIRAKPDDDDPLNEEMDVWRHCYRFFAENSAFQFNEEDPRSININYQEYPLLRTLMNRYWQGDDSIRIKEQDLNEINPNDFVSYNSQQKFFVGNTSRLLKVKEDNTGCIIKKTSDFIKQWGMLKEEHPLFISKKQGKSKRLTSWEQVSNYTLPLNAVVICDNYICSHYWSVENNLFKLLSTILIKKELEVPIDILIITKSLYKENGSLKETSLKCVHDRLSREIKNIIGNDFFNLTMVKTELPGTHDRYIFTNYYVLNSGNGFSYFSKDDKIIAPSFTEFKVTPRTISKQQSDIFIDMLEQLKEIVLAAEKSNIIGTCKNRLLDL